jgi:type IV pilus assembly protein PilB
MSLADFLVNNIIDLALRKSASDIHLEPAEDGVRIRYRIDGVLWEAKLLPRKVRLPLTSRLKIMSGLDITERRIPQDGRISLKVADKTVDFRVSTMPSRYGEKVVVRILDKEAQVWGLDKLITHRETLTLVRQMIRKPYGIIYCTGPTGSGKTTTLYSALAELNSTEVNILTVEDPVEYDLPGITQVQVNPDIGLDFARVVRAFLRQDPDIILVGETRDKETAKTAVQAALTGHIVLTTLHTNDAPSTFVRLVEMGIEPLLISTSLVGIVAQRLVRRICARCKEPFPADQTTSGFLGLKEGAVVYRGVGCEVCNHSGYKGRVGVYEVLVANEEIRHLVARGAGTERIREQAIGHGMRTLKEYASLLLAEGVTTVDEVLRTVAVDT